MQILGLDVGTSAVKSAVLDVETTKPVGEIARVDYDLHYPTSDAVEIDPEELWSAVTEAARKAMHGFETIDGIGFSCLMPALVLLDKDAMPLRPIWTHLDRRSRQTARQVQASDGEAILRTTGNRPIPGGISAVCFRQMLKDDPYLVRHTRHYFHLNTWLAHRLTGEAIFDRANASFTGLYNTVTDQRWNPQWCKLYEVDPQWLPPVHCGTTTVGTVLSERAGEINVQAGAPVKIGTADTSSAILGLEVREGDLLHTVGTTQVLATITQNPQPSEKRLVRQLGVGDVFLHVTHNPVGGVAFEWMYQLCFQDQSPEEFYDKTIFDAIDIDTRAHLDPPYLGGDRLQIEAVRAGFRDLTLSTDRMELLAAVLRELKDQHVKAVEGLGREEPFDRIFLTGGGADVIQRLIPDYESVQVQGMEEAALRGVAKLFDADTASQFLKKK